MKALPLVVALDMLCAGAIAGQAEPIGGQVGAVRILGALSKH
jgi:hypothetical protein